jgi:hypothetical protein
MLELDFRLVDRTGDGRGTRGLRRAGQRNMPFAREQTRGGIEPHPAGAR